LHGEAPATVDEFAEQLLQWFKDTYPGAVPATASVIENWIRETWHRRHELIRGG
jgi:hypothetical protein